MRPLVLGLIAPVSDCNPGGAFAFCFHLNSSFLSDLYPPKKGLWGYPRRRSHFLVLGFVPCSRIPLVLDLRTLNNELNPSSGAWYLHLVFSLCAFLNVHAFCGWKSCFVKKSCLCFVAVALLINLAQLLRL